MNQQQIEQVLLEQFGAEQVVWLEKGVAGDVDTDGHIDNIACFVEEDLVISQNCDKQSENFAIYEENRQILRENNLKLVDRERDEVISLLNKIEFTLTTENAPSIDELLKIIEASPRESLPRYQLATQLINQEDFEAGLEHLLYTLQHDRKFQDDAAHQAMLSAFTLMGDDNSLVGQYRRKMFNAMH